MILSRRYLAALVGFVTLGSGLMNLYMVMHPHFPPTQSFFADVFPLEFFRLSRFLTLLIGFALAITSLALFRRKKRAWWAAAVSSVLAVVFHLLQGLDWRGSVFATVLLVLLVATRPVFTVRSIRPDLRAALTRIAVVAALAIAYGVAGFWLLEVRHFEKNFHIWEAVRQTFISLSLFADPGLEPRTHYARWFLDSLRLTSIGGIVYAGLSLYRPVVQRFRVLPHERRRAAALVARYGRSSLDFFKYWPDKSFFFSDEGDAFLAYRVGMGHALVLGDPVGAEEAIEPLARAFKDFCCENDWRLAFHQTSPDHLAAYERLGLRRLKIGDDAIIDLASFDLEGRSRKEFRNVLSRLEREGVTYAREEPPLADALVRELRAVSDEWLHLPGRRERQFTLGRFDDAYVRATPVALVRDAAGKVVAFANLIPSFVPGEATIDLMRRRRDIPHGCMDFLFIKLFFQLKEAGFGRFDLGMAPMAGFTSGESATPEERALHAFFRRLNFLFSFAGMRAYKAKFASSWEPRYLVHEGILDLPAVALALARVSELRGRRRTDDERAYVEADETAEDESSAESAVEEETLEEQP